MDHIYIYFVDEYDRTVEFEIQGYPSYESVYADAMDFDEFLEFFCEYSEDGSCKVHIDEEDRGTLMRYFGYDILL